MKEPSTKVISFPSPVPSKADYQRVKSSYSIKEIKQLFGLSEKTLRRWTEQGIIQASPTSQAPEYVYDFNALTQFRRVRELRAQGHSIRQIEAELQGQLNLFRIETPRLARLLTPFEEALLLHEQGDTKATDALQQMATYLGRGIAPLVAGLAPDMIVIVGEVTRAWRLVGPTIKETVRQHSFTPAETQLVPSDPITQPRLRGTIALVLLKHFGAPAVA
jgi:DNA-binding transcriptional MerR regulator